MEVHDELGNLYILSFSLFFFFFFFGQEWKCASTNIYKFNVITTTTISMLWNLFNYENLDVFVYLCFEC